MYNFKEHVLDGNSFPLTLIVAFTLLLNLNSCSDSGSVGGSIGNPNAELQVDTLEVSSYSTEMLNSYSGDNSYFSAGRFNDPHFGDVSATALLKPFLAGDSDTLSFDQDTEMLMRLAINSSTVYGDSLSEMSFDVVEISELWRGPAWRLNNEVPLVSGSPVASFTVSGDDTLEVPLSDEWTQKYGEFYNRTDSLRNEDYTREFFGLALVPRNSGRVITFDPDSTWFIINNLEGEAEAQPDDSLRTRLQDYAFSVDRTDESSRAETVNTYNTLERVFTLDFDFSSDRIRPINIAKAELVIYRDSLLLEESINQAGTRAVRPSAGPLRLHLVADDELPQALDPGSDLIQPASYDEEDNAYHFNLTQRLSQSFFEQIDESLKLYVTQTGNDGVIRSNILFNNESGPKSPKLIITSTNNR